MEYEAVVVGAGTAGLACAGELQRAGMVPVVVEKSRGVGGRCATRRVEDQPVDHGAVFLHGADSGFLAELDAVDAEVLEGWPSRVEGTGTPCQPEAFHSYERRLAYVEGVNAFPKHLARGLDLRLQSRAAALEIAQDRFRLVVEGESGLSTRTLVLALPVEQTLALLDSSMLNARELAAVRDLLGMMRSLPCLTLLAGYPLSVNQPDWDVSYPEDSESLMLISHDSAKRKEKRVLTLVYQCQPRWSRQRLEGEPTAWRDELLEEATRILGPWAGRPLWSQEHRWRYARAEPANTLAGPMLLSLTGGLRLGLAGEIFTPGGGVEAAWLSGRRLAERILGETTE